MAFCSCRSGQALSSEGACPRQYVSLTMQPHLGKLRPPPEVSLCLYTDRCLRVLLHSGQYLLEQGQGYRVRKQYEAIGIRAGYSNTAWIDFITTDDQCGGVHFKLAERLWGSILTMKRANVSQEPLIARTRDGPTRERPGLGMGARLAGFRYVPDFLDRPPSRAVSTPMRRTRSPCCARAASGHATRRRAAWLRISSCDIACHVTPPVGGHSCNGGIIPRFHRAVWD